MDLAFRELGGAGAPVVILHGLFGSSQNWAGIGRRLAAVSGGSGLPRGSLYALDLRNHGDSPHAPTHSLRDCVEDLRDWTMAHASGPLRLIGHSMGGLVAMGFALSHPELVAGVASVDIAPRPYPRDHEREFRALHTDISGCERRAELDALLAPLIPDQRERQFLLMNAVAGGRRVPLALQRRGTGKAHGGRRLRAGWRAATTARPCWSAAAGPAYVRPSDQRGHAPLLPAGPHRINSPGGPLAATSRAAGWSSWQVPRTEFLDAIKLLPSRH